MDLRIDAGACRGWYEPADESVAALPDTAVPDSDWTTELAGRLTRLSTLLGVMMHMIRVDDLSEAEREQLTQSAALAQREIDQAGILIRSQRKQQTALISGRLNVKSLVQEVIAGVLARFPRTPIECSVMLEDCGVNCDELVMHSLLTGLVQHAVERLVAAGDSGGELTVILECQNNLLRLVLKTNGPGVANVLPSGRDEMSSKMTTTSPNCLQRCTHLASQLGGSLSMSSRTVGEQATIQFELPTLTSAR